MKTECFELKSVCDGLGISVLAAEPDVSAPEVVILLSHCSIEKFKTPEEEYKNYAPSMERSFSEVLTQWADCVFFAKAQSRHGGERRLYCQPTARYFAKSRYFNDEFIPIDYDSFRECCIKGKETYWQNAQNLNEKEEEK